MNNQTFDDLLDFTGKLDDFKFYSLPFENDIVQKKFIGTKSDFEIIGAVAAMELVNGIKYVLRYYKDNANFYNLAISVCEKYLPEIDINTLAS